MNDTPDSDLLRDSLRFAAVAVAAGPVLLAASALVAMGYAFAVVCAFRKTELGADLMGAGPL